jgi:hypothetical protein
VGSLSAVGRLLEDVDGDGDLVVVEASTSARCASEDRPQARMVCD